MTSGVCSQSGALLAGPATRAGTTRVLTPVEGFSACPLDVQQGRRWLWQCRPRAAALLWSYKHRLSSFYLQEQHQGRGLGAEL